MNQNKNTLQKPKRINTRKTTKVIQYFHNTSNYYMKTGSLGTKLTRNNKMNKNIPQIIPSMEKN